MRFDVDNIRKFLGSKFNLHDHCSSTGSICLVIESADLVLGYICCVRDMDIYQVLDVFVAAEVRGQGLGRALVHRVRDLIGADASMEAMLEMGDTGSLAFFKAVGFKVVDCLEGDVVLLREGWRFKHAPSLQYRITKED